MQITNDLEHLSFENAWTHTGTTGNRRQIDFILADKGFHFYDTFGIIIIDMGSDHHAVFIEVLLARRCLCRWRKPVVQRGWRPDEIYCDIVKEGSKTETHSIPELNNLLNSAYDASMTKKGNRGLGKTKPWQMQSVQNLLTL